MRRRAHRDAAGPAGLPGAARRPRDVPQRHAVHPRDPRPGRGGAAAVGPARRHRQADCPPSRPTASTSGRSRSGAPRPPRTARPRAYAPRRTLLDKVLVDAAARPAPRCGSGSASTRSSSRTARVVGVRGRDAGRRRRDRARHRRDRRGRPPLRGGRAPSTRRSYHEKPPLQHSYYTYWRGPAGRRRSRSSSGPSAGFAAVATNDDLTMLVVGWPTAEREAYKADIEGNYLKTLDLAPELADRVRAATRAERFAGGAVANYFRKPYGPGWVLIGDAGYSKDPITAQGITRRVPGRPGLRGRARPVLRGRAHFDDVHGRLPAHPRRRALPIYGFTTSWPPWNRRRPRRSNSLPPPRATSRPWTGSSASPPAPSPRRVLRPGEHRADLRRRPVAGPVGRGPGRHSPPAQLAQSARRHPRTPSPGASHPASPSPPRPGHPAGAVPLDAAHQTSTPSSACSATTPSRHACRLARPPGRYRPGPSFPRQ